MKEKIKVKIIEESLWDRLPQHVKDEINSIINAKPKELVEVVYGKNISKSGFLCSICGFGDFDGFREYKPNYCPNCGADMRGK